MADLAITAATVVRGTGAKIEAGIAGGAITAGQTVYKTRPTTSSSCAMPMPARPSSAPRAASR